MDELIRLNGRDQPERFPTDQHRLLVLDGNNIVMRSLFGMAGASLVGPNGIPSGGLYGAIKTLQAYIARTNPTHALWTFDQGRSTYRTGLHPEYKANRPGGSGSTSLPDGAVAATFAALREFLDLVNIRHHAEQGVEADDHIAQAAFRYSAEMQVVIVSSDHDLRQLVDKEGRILLIKPRVSAKVPEVVYDHDQVVAEYGLAPHRLPEMWALMGDSGDNINGIPKIGPKTAAKIILEHGSLDKACINSPKVWGHEELVRRNLRLIRLSGLDSGVRFSSQEMVLRRDEATRYNHDLQRFLTHWGFSSLLNKISDGGSLWT